MDTETIHAYHDHVSSISSAADWRIGAMVQTTTPYTADASVTFVPS